MRSVEPEVLHDRFSVTWAGKANYAIRLECRAGLSSEFDQARAALSARSRSRLSNGCCQRSDLLVDVFHGTILEHAIKNCHGEQVVALKACTPRLRVPASKPPEPSGAGLNDSIHLLAKHFRGRFARYSFCLVVDFHLLDCLGPLVYLAGE